MTRKKFFITILSIVFLVILGFCAWIFVSGRAAIVWKDSKTQSVVLGSQVCDSTAVQTYNAVTQYQQREGSDVETFDEAGLKKILTDVKSKSGYDTDPTCQTMVLMGAILTGDYQAASEAYAAVNDLHAKQQYADNNLNGVSPVPVYESLVEDLNPENQDETNQRQQGGE